MGDENLERITILLQARDRDFQRAMDRNNKVISKLARDAGRSTDQMANRITDNLDRMTSGVKNFAVGFAGGIAGGVISAALTQVTSNLRATVRGIAEVGDSAKRSGLGLQAFQEWSFVAEQNRVSVDALVDGFKELNLRADEWITTGGGSAAEAFQRLGFTASDLAGRLKDPSALMLEIVGRLQRMDEAAQIRIADELFGGTGGEQFVQLLDKGQIGIQGQITRARELGLVLDEGAVRKAAELDAKFSEVEARIGSMWRTGVVGAAEFFGLVERESAKLNFDPDTAARVFGKGTSDAMANLPEVPQDAIAEVEGLRLEYIALADEARMLVPALSDASIMLRGMGNEAGAVALTDLAARIGDAARAFEDGEISGAEYTDQLRLVVTEAQNSLTAMSDLDQVALTGVIGQVSSLLGWIGQIPAAAAAARNQVASLAMMDTGTPLTGDGAELLPPSPLAPTESPRPRARPFELGVPDPPKPVGGSGRRGGGSGGAKASSRYRDDSADWREEVAGLLAEAEALNDLVLSYDEYGIAQDVARRRAELLQAAQEDGKAITPQLRSEIDALAKSYEEAAAKSEAARARHEEFRDAVEDAKGTLASAFVGLVTGADSFRSALSNVIAKLAEMLAMSAFEKLWGGGLGGAVGKALGGLGFARGGYTGPGPRNEIAGAVHRGEVVWSQDDIRAAGGVRAVDAMRRGARAVAPSGSVSAAEQRALSVSITMDSSTGDFVAIARDEAGRVMAQARPEIVRASVSAASGASRSTKSAMGVR